MPGGLWLRAPHRLQLRLSAASAVMARLPGERSASEFTAMAAGGPPVLAGCLLQTGASCHMGPFRGQLITGQPAPLRASA